MSGQGIPSWAVRGAEVQCISINPEWARLSAVVPVVGERYHLDRIDIDPFDGTVICTVAEIGDQFCVDEDAEGFVVFGLFRFRPLITRTESEDLAIFAPLLRQAEHA